MEEIKESILEVVFAVLPITVLIIILQFTLIWLPMDEFLKFIAGTIMVSLGLIFFLIGVNIGLLPVGELIGATLPKTKKLWLIILFGFILGFVVTVAEPDVRVLSSQVDQVSNGEISSNVLIYSVALGVGFFVGISMLNSFLNIPIKFLLVGSYSLVFLLAFFIPREFIPISFDAGGVTTGPMTVPFILALGIGVASVLSRKKSSTDGFGIVALASIGPIIAVMILGVLFQ
ncbi:MULTISPECIES: DUF1538 domain-containing protein [Bacillus]|uniref:DUF1538 domain-containing protein n=1 Tax=Bacillus TaxID=1386 RepID=UPI000BB75627|nr:MULTISPECIES: DUF1538 domain-containing protein [Bacillus]